MCYFFFILLRVFVFVCLRHVARVSRVSCPPMPVLRICHVADRACCVYVSAHACLCTRPTLETYRRTLCQSHTKNARQKRTAHVLWLQLDDDGDDSIGRWIHILNNNMHVPDTNAFRRSLCAPYVSFRCCCTDCSAVVDIVIAYSLLIATTPSSQYNTNSHRLCTL